MVYVLCAAYSSGSDGLPLVLLRLAGHALARLGIWLTLSRAIPSTAAAIVGRVVSVHDGDTSTSLVDRRQVKLRLTDIAAPEQRQAYGRRACQALADICAGTEANAEMVRRGLAWVFVKYAPGDSPLFAVESGARLAKRGLWAEDRPVPLWEWRRKDQD